MSEVFSLTKHRPIGYNLHHVSLYMYIELLEGILVSSRGRELWTALRWPGQYTALVVYVQTYKGHTWYLPTLE